MCNKEFTWNSSNWDSECDKSCDVEEYLDYKIVVSVERK